MQATKVRRKIMKITIDRIEGEYAVVELENKTMLDMSILLIPEGAKEGDIISIEIDKKETETRTKRIEKLMHDLWE